MLTVLGPRLQYCDGVSRRSFLKIGGLAVGELALPHLLRADERSRSARKSVIMVYLSGGLAHQDTFDLKPHAPAEIRGEFKPIPTRVAGVQFGELLPKLAACADKLAVLRSVSGLRDEHSSWQNMTGTTMDQAKREGKPHIGSVIAKVAGSDDPAVPAFVDLSPVMQHKPYNSPGPGLLGRSAAPMRLDGQDLAVMTLSGVTHDELSQRRRLLDGIDQFRRAADGLDRSGMDVYYQKAFDVLTSSKLVAALDVTKEPAVVRERYGRGSPRHLGDGAPMWNDQLLMARRLVEAGARCVTVAYGFWDTHGGNFKYLRQHLPLFDQGISALVEDIYARGLDRDVTVLVWGEFGRTPKINKDAGRDHWARVNGALFAGGGLKVGQVIGATDSTAAYAVDTPIPYQDVLATVYHNLGIDPHGMVRDVGGRPTPILPGTAQVISRVL
jgi:hypothetical protein